MSDELRTDFNAEERKTIINQLCDEYGDREFSDELILLECQDLWRKGCHHLEQSDYCLICHDCHDGSGLQDWEKRHPEYANDELAKRLKALKDELRRVQKDEIEKSLLAKGYVKVQWKQWNDGSLTTSDVVLYLPGSKELAAAVAKAIENWRNMWGVYFELDKIDLNAKSGVILDLRTDQGDEYEVWEIIK